MKKINIPHLKLIIRNRENEPCQDSEYTLYIATYKPGGDENNYNISFSETMKVICVKYNDKSVSDIDEIKKYLSITTQNNVNPIKLTFKFFISGKYKIIFSTITNETKRHLIFNVVNDWNELYNNRNRLLNYPSGYNMSIEQISSYINLLYMICYGMNTSFLNEKYKLYEELQRMRIIIRKQIPLNSVHRNVYSNYDNDMRMILNRISCYIEEIIYRYHDLTLKDLQTKITNLKKNI